jgi:biopolymer transport protein TolR
MGAAMQGSGNSSGARRGRRRSRRMPMSEINVTPFVDVMLVLLIIFMVTAPLLTVGVPVELPKTQAETISDASQKEPLTVSVREDGKIFLQEMEISLEEIVPKLTAIAKNGVEDVIYIRGDRRANYGVMMQIMGRISGSGLRRISLVTDLQERM